MDKKNFSYLMLASLLFSGFSLFLLGNLFSNLNLILISIILIFAMSVFFTVGNLYKRIIFLSFCITFFTFLIGRPIIKVLNLHYDYYNLTKYGFDNFTEDTLFKVFNILFFGLVFTFIGYALSEYLFKNKNPNSSLKTPSTFLLSVREISKYLFYFTFLFNLMVIFEKINYTSNNGYEELYSSYISTYPVWFVKISEMCQVALFLFLATKPQRKQTMLPLIMYLFLASVSLFVGQRNYFVLSLLIVFIYLALRQWENKEDSWLKMKYVIMLPFISILLIPLLNSISYFRNNEITKLETNPIFEFFYSQGVSINLLGHAQNYPENEKYYSIGRLIDFLKNNYFTQALTNIEGYRAQTIDSIVYGNSFADDISYYLSPQRFLNGWGYGSSYLAEFYLDGGYIGVIIGSAIMGVILFLLTRLFFLNFFGAWVSLTMTKLIIYAPRDTFTSFVVSTFNIINIFTLMMILITAYLLKDYFHFKKTRTMSISNSTQFYYRIKE